MNSYPSKVFFVGENDWTGLVRPPLPSCPLPLRLGLEQTLTNAIPHEQKGGDDLDTFYSTIEKMDGSGSMMWSIFGHGASSPFALLPLIPVVLTTTLHLQMTAAATGSTT